MTKVFRGRTQIPFIPQVNGANISSANPEIHTIKALDPGTGFYLDFLPQPNYSPVIYIEGVQATLIDTTPTLTGQIQIDYTGKFGTPGFCYCHSGDLNKSVAIHDYRGFQSIVTELDLNDILTRLTSAESRISVLEAGGVETLDQSYTPASITSSSVIGKQDATTWRSRGIQFTCGKTGTLTKVDLLLSKSNVYTGDGDITVEIYSDNGTDGLGSLLATGTIASFSSPSIAASGDPNITHYEWKSAIFNVPANVVSGQKYWIKLYTTVDNVAYWLSNAGDGTGYANGIIANGNGTNFAGDNTAWSNYTAVDFCFKTYVTA